MCLYHIEGKPKKTKGKGWKIFEYTGYKSIYKGARTKKTTNAWINERDFREDSLVTLGAMMSFKKYPPGFHIYAHKKDAIDVYRYLGRVWHIPIKLKQVKYRKAHTWGFEDGKKVIVADEMFIPEDKND